MVSKQPSEPARVEVSAKADWAEEAVLSSPAIPCAQRQQQRDPRAPPIAAAPRDTRPFLYIIASHTIERAMSVKFEKETIKTTTAAVADAAGKGKDDLMAEVSKAISKGTGPNGYLAVSVAHAMRGSATLSEVNRRISSSSRATRCAPRCSRPAPFQACRSFSHRGSRMTGARAAITSPRAYPRWPCTAP
jgi:hypothetical protein